MSTDAPKQRRTLTLTQRLRLADWIMHHRAEIPTSTVHEFLARAREHFKNPELTRLHILSTLKSLEISPSTPRFKSSPRNPNSSRVPYSVGPTRAELASLLAGLFVELGLEVPDALRPFGPSSPSPSPNPPRYGLTPEALGAQKPPSSPLSPSPLRPRW